MAAARRRHGLGGAFLGQLRRLVPFAGETADVIHFEQVGYACERLALLEALEPATVVSCRGTDVLAKPLTNAEYAAKVRGALALADAVHCVSDHILEAATRYGLDPAKAFVQHRTVDTAYFTRSAELPEGDVTH